MLTGEPISKVRVNFNFKNVRTMRLNSDLKVLTDEMTKTNMMILSICETKRNMSETFVVDDLYHCYMGKADKRIGGMKFNGIDKPKYGCKYYKLEYKEKNENDFVNKFSAISGFNIVNSKFNKRRNKK
uniref:Uncharacterized protein n=1 Tax=Strongyloides venezuelensis TaxID=75913 RepID=A0A0K0F591_STRVS